jgi:hypothetical protein
MADQNCGLDQFVIQRALREGPASRPAEIECFGVRESENHRFAGEDSLSRFFSQQSHQIPVNRIRVLGFHS